MLGVELLEPLQLLLLLVAALAAGWIDAIVGGGGLIQLPTLLLLGVPPVAALGTNKVAGIAGTSVSAFTYWRYHGLNLRLLRVSVAAAVAGAAGGSALATVLPNKIFLPIVLVVLLAVGVFVTFRKDFGTSVAPSSDSLISTRKLALLAAGTFLIGGYDGFIGPGTGTFLVVLLAAAGCDFLTAASNAKAINTATNLASLLIFIPYGAVLWGPGLLMAVANIIGGYLGARTAIKAGSRFIRYILLIVVVALVVRISVMIR